MKHFALQFEQRDLAVVHFVEEGPDLMWVVGIRGAIEYYDAKMSKEAAREIWRKLTEEGWKQVDAKKTTAIDWLRTNIYT